MGPRQAAPGSLSVEAVLVERARQGDSDAFGELLGLYQASVFSFVRRLVGRYDEAVEVAQEAFLQAFKSCGRFQFDRPLRPWLFKIALNVCRNHLRSTARRELPFETLPEAQPLWQEAAQDAEQRLVRQTDLDLLARLLADLSPDERALLVLRFREEMSYDDLGHVFSLPQAVLKMRLCRLLKRLRALMPGVLQ